MPGWGRQPVRGLESTPRPASTPLSGSLLPPWVARTQLGLEEVEHPTERLHACAVGLPVGEAAEVASLHHVHAAAVVGLLIEDPPEGQRKGGSSGGNHASSRPRPSALAPHCPECLIRAWCWGSTRWGLQIRALAAKFKFSAPTLQLTTLTPGPGNSVPTSDPPGMHVSHRHPCRQNKCMKIKIVCKI